MESRFKFRAWNKENKKYIYGVEKGLEFYSTAGNLRVMTLAEIAESSRYDLEQCTGLKDKNGKLIYEGDIVEVTSPENWNIFDEYSNSEILGKGVVVTKPGCAFIKKNDIDGEEKEYYFVLYSVVEDADVEVVGNIHENPELLEEDK